MHGAATTDTAFLARERSVLIATLLPPCLGWVTFMTRRLARPEVVELFIRECPHYVRGTFAAA